MKTELNPAHRNHPPNIVPRVRPQITDEHAKLTGAFIPIASTFAVSTGIAALTSFRENVFGGLTIGIQMLSTFAALFTGTIGLALKLTQNPNSEGTSYQSDFTHG